MARERKAPSVYTGCCERYNICLDGMGWAIIAIAESGGVFMTVGDFGNYGYTWPCHGRPTFKHFLVEIDRNYLCGKLGRRDYFLPKETKREWRREVLTCRRRLGISKETARQAWDAIEAMEFTNPDEIYRDWEQTPALKKVFEDPCCMPCVKDFEPALRMFADRIWPVFVETLRAELKGSTPRSNSDAEASAAVAEEKRRIVTRIESVVGDAGMQDYITHAAADLVVLHGVPLCELERILGDLKAMRGAGSLISAGRFFHSKVRKLAAQHGKPWPK